MDWNGTITAGAVVEIGFGGTGSFSENVNQASFNGDPITIFYTPDSGGGGSDDGGSDDGGSDDGGSDGGGSDAGSDGPDFTGDGSVDGADLTVLLAAWGSLP